MTINKDKQRHNQAEISAAPYSRAPRLDNRGFTLVELIIVTAIIIVLSLIGINAFTSAKEMARASRAMTEIRHIEKDINTYIIDNVALPPNLEALGRGILKDPWGRPYHFVPFTVGGMRRCVTDLNTDYDLYSDGSNGISALSTLDNASKDDVLRANDGAWVGYANKY